MSGRKIIKIDKLGGGQDVWNMQPGSTFTRQAIPLDNKILGRIYAVILTIKNVDGDKKYLWFEDTHQRRLTLVTGGEIVIDQDACEAE